MYYTYNNHLNFIVWDAMRKYGINSWLDFPHCLEDRVVRFALKLVH